MDQNVLPTCPKCKQTDQIQKVTSIYGANTKDWYETRTRTDIHGHTESYKEFHEAHTQLGLKLMPPPKPESPTHPGLWYGIGGVVAFILLSVLCPIALTAPTVLIPLIAASAALPDISSQLPNWQAATIAVVGGMLCVGLVLLGFLIWFGIRMKHRYDRDMATYTEKKYVYERDELSRWQHAEERWEQLYYCMRDDTVFIPSENKAIRADDLQKYLYDPLFRSQPY